MQFSLRTLFAAVAVVSCTVGALRVRPDWLAGTLMALLSVVFAVVLLGGVLHAKRSMQTFCIAALVPAAIAFFLVLHTAIHRILEPVWADDILNVKAAAGEALKYRFLCGVLWAEMPSLGALCYILDWLLFFRSKSPPENPEERTNGATRIHRRKPSSA